MRMLTPKQLAKRWVVSTATLQDWRKLGQGPTYVKLGSSHTSPVRHMTSDVEAWEASLPRIEPISRWIDGANNRHPLNPVSGDSSPTMLTPRELADRIGVDEPKLKLWRMSGKGPVYIKLGFAEASPIR